ncbi:MAG TPA: exonuclease SbcCD subunit D C-terminal domain-containing protein [Paenalcaligenes sp.]|nr:exonuclease SbcCD subunit D C-terminal domain-containing protein [Paenalcaligenes sp.]
MSLTVLHTSDWHLGRLLYGRSRDSEFESFLQWLLETIRRRQVDVLLVAGDVFDSSTPTHQAQTLYYRFLSAVSLTACQHVVIIGGNHDSPTLLNAPQELLKALHVHVIGQALRPEDEVLVLYDADQCPQLIVAAVPYLRERDVRQVHSGESLEEKAAGYVHGVEQYYTEIAEQALACQQELEKKVPIIAMGHLFTAGGYTQSDDGVRDVIVGGLGHIRPQLFDQVFDYVALGHLHVPQRVGQRDWVRYSGSPLPMGFGEAQQQKSVCLIQIKNADKPESTPQDSMPSGAVTKSQSKPTSADNLALADNTAFSDNVTPADSLPPAEQKQWEWQRLQHQFKVQLLPVPVFQRLRRIEGDWTQIEAQILAYKRKLESIWLEIIYTGDEVVGELRARVSELIEDSPLEVLRLQNQMLMREILAPVQAEKPLPELTPYEVFERRLEALQVASEQRAELLHTYGEALQLLEEEQPTEEAES